MAKGGGGRSTENLGDYVKLEQIGEGSFGYVHRGIRKDSNVIVALKFISKAGRKEPELAKLREECLIQKDLKHPNIIRMLDSFETEKNVVVVTEHAVTDLYRILHKKYPLNTLAEISVSLPEEKVGVLACHVISALYYLHSNRILHRDIKPQNILLGNDGRYKLCDFGFARSMDIGTYVLTSMKGTPLYMAPEVVQEHPYDHNADLWSLGCILYEALTSRAPFHTLHLLELVQKIKHEPIRWPNFISDNCRSFLQGLLEKDPAKRLTWPGLLNHTFVKDGLQMCETNIQGPFSLTNKLSPSQELAKEGQRQFLQRKVANYSRLMVKTAKKMKEAQKELNECSDKQTKTDDPKIVAGDHCTLANDLSTLKISETGNTNEGEVEDSDSLETDSSSSEGSSYVTDEDDRRTVVPEQAEKSGEGEAVLWKSGALFSLHSFGSEDKPLESEEWISFIIHTMKEVLDNPKTLTEKHLLTMLIAPLRNHLASEEVVEKIALLLSLPFVVETRRALDVGVSADLKTVYLDTKVLPNLIYATKLVVRRRRVEKSTGDLTEVSSLLSAEDLDALDKCLRVVTFLVHWDEQFVVQLCDSLCVLQGIPVLQLFLRLSKRKHRLATDTLAILCHVLRTVPQHSSIVEEVLGDTTEHCTLWRLLEDDDLTIQCRSLRILGYLFLHSERCRGHLIERDNGRLLCIINKTIEHPHVPLRDAGNFALTNVYPYYT